MQGVKGMELEVSIEDLLNKRKVESDRIEFKAGWNPDDIYRSVCAFANDYNNDGGGYILVGVEEKNGVAVRRLRCRNTRTVLRFCFRELPIYKANT